MIIVAIVLITLIFLWYWAGVKITRWLFGLKELKEKFEDYDPLHDGFTEESWRTFKRDFKTFMIWTSPIGGIIIVWNWFVIPAYEDKRKKVKDWWDGLHQPE